MFCHFWQKFENSKWPPFLGRGKFLEEYPVGRKFRQNRSICTVKEIEGNLCFPIFGKNSKIQNGRHFWGGENFWKIAKHTLDTLWVENFDEITLSRTVKEIEAN